MCTHEHRRIYLTSTIDHFFNILVNLTIDNASLFTLTIHIFTINWSWHLSYNQLLSWFHVSKDVLIIMFFSFWSHSRWGGASGLTAGGVVVSWASCSAVRPFCTAEGQRRTTNHQSKVVCSHFSCLPEFCIHASSNLRLHQFPRAALPRLASFSQQPSGEQYARPTK